ncbi:MAG: hypothetical protein SOT34_06345, partial [Candidatus Borkfalkiaceae bacterium]|nr:hypothetical protein [Christensenellaceae bacterium]
ENCANGDFEGAGRVNVCIDATMDISLLKNLFGKLVGISERFGFDGEKREVWKSILSKLPSYRVNGDGALAEWIHSDFGDNYRHRHLSHLFPVFPGCEIGEKHELFRAADKALELRMAYGLRDVTGWALAHTANVYARLKNASGVGKCLDLIARHFIGENLLGYHNNDELMGVGVYIRWCNHAPHQLDVSSGFTSALQESVCFCDRDAIRILPAFKGDVSARGILLRGGITVRRLQRKGDRLTAEFRSSGEKKVRVCFPVTPSEICVDGKKILSSAETEVFLPKGVSVSIECVF